MTVKRYPSSCLEDLKDDRISGQYGIDGIDGEVGLRLVEEPDLDGPAESERKCRGLDDRAQVIMAVGRMEKEDFLVLLNGSCRGAMPLVSVDASGCRHR